MQRILNSLFGRPAEKKVTKVAKVAALDVMPTLETLSMQEKTMEKKLQHLELRIKNLVKEAENHLRNNDKTKALQLLKQKAMLEEQVKSSQTMLNLLIQQRMALETTQLQHATIKAIETTNTFLRQSHDSLNVEKAETIMEEVHETIETQKEIGHILAQPLPGQQEAEEAANRELEEMMGKAYPTPTVNPMTASVPVAPVAASSSAAELAALERSDERVALPA
jgi:hypothetical protein